MNVRLRKYKYCYSNLGAIYAKGLSHCDKRLEYHPHALQLVIGELVVTCITGNSVDPFCFIAYTA